jgi:hypothetical protein
MSKVHLARSGFITKAALPSITRQRGTTTGTSDLMLFGAGKTTVANNTTFIDSSTNAFTVTRNGDTVHSGHNPFSTVSDGSAYFDGTGDYLTIPNNSAFNLGSSNFTIEAWVYPTVSGTEKQIITKYDAYPSGFEWNLDILNTEILLFNGYGTSYFEVRSTTTIAINTWTHVAAVRNGATITIYINGVSSGTVSAQTFQTTTANVAVGRDLEASGATRIFTGYISNARVVKGTAVYTSNFTPSTSALTAITNTQLLLLTDNYSIVNSTPTPLPVTINGNTTISTAQYPTGMTRSIYFDGTGDYVSNASANLTTTGDTTIEFWVRLASASGYDTVITIGNEASGRWFFGFNNGAPVIDRFGVGTTTFGSAVSTNVWYHIAFVRSSNTVSCYVNGVSAGTPTSITGTIGNTSGFYVGAASNASSAIEGYVSNLRLCNGTALYTANFTPPSLPLSVNISVPANVTNAIYGVNQLA